MPEPNFASSNPGQNPNVAQYLANRVDGKMMRALKIERESKVLAFKRSGQSQPATVINFNPLPLRMDASLEFSVPAATSEAVPDREKLRFTYKGKQYPATVLTIHEPIAFTWITDVKKYEDVEVGVYNIEICKQIEIAHAMRTAYTFGTPSSSGMGGVLIFQGTRKALEHKDGGGRVVLKVPAFEPLPNKKREYFTEDRFLDEELRNALDMQKRYCQLSTQQAQAFWDQEDQRGNITDVHRIWHQFEMDMGWRTTPAPWITLQHELSEPCEGCGTPRKRATAFFCPACARPYDPLKAYFAGEIPLDHPSMNRVPPAEWPRIREEETRRKALREG